MRSGKEVTEQTKCLLALLFDFRINLMRKLCFWVGYTIVSKNSLFWGKRYTRLVILSLVLSKLHLVEHKTKVVLVGDPLVLNSHYITFHCIKNCLSIPVEQEW